MNIMRYELQQDKNGYTLVVFLDPQLEEFSDELGRSSKTKINLQIQIQNLIKEKFPNVNISTARVIWGAMLVTTIYLGSDIAKASAETTTNQVQQSSQTDVYKVQPGDTLYSIAKRLNITTNSLKTINGLTSDNIYVGQILNLPYYTYTVLSGDTLYSISKRFNLSVDSVLSYNQLTSNSLFVGQQLKIPVTPNQTATVIPNPSVGLQESTGTYTVVAGDSLYSISRKLNTTVSELRTLNNLTSDTVYIGQVLKVPTNQQANQVNPTPPVTEQTPLPTDTPVVQPVPDISTYTVVSGDTLYSIARRFNTTVDSIKTLNHLSSNSISPGQQLTIPKSTMAEIIPPSIPALNPIGNISLNNQASVLISGSAEANSMVDISLTDGATPPLVNRIKADANGKFEARVNVSDLNDGNIVVSAKSVDPFGNESSESSLTAAKDTFTVDPVIDNKMQVTFENVRDYTIFGLTENGAKVELTISDGINPAIKVTATANETGEFRTNSDLLSLNDGPLIITARAFDLFGNESQVKQTTIIKDTKLAAPVIENTAYINSQNSASYTIFGRSLPNSSVNILVSDGKNQNITASAITDQNGEFHANVNVSALADGDLTINATQTSTSGVKSQVGKATITKDTAAPVAPVLNNNNVINKENQRSFLLTGTGDANTLINVKAFNESGMNIEKVVQTNETGQYSIPFDLSSFNDGNISFALSQIDQAGNISPLTVKTLLKDTVGPTILNLKPQPTIFSGNTGNYRISGVMEPQVTYTMTIADGFKSLTKTGTTDSSGNFDFSVDTSALADGDITVSFTATDMASNTNTLPSTTILKDTVAPAAVIPTLAQYVNSLNEHNYLVNGASAEEGAQVKMLISDGTTNITKTATVTSGWFNTSFDLSSLKEGPLKLEIAQTDKAGNTGVIQASTISKDTIAESPIVSKSGYTLENQQSGYRVIGTAEPNSSVKVSLLNANGVEVLSSIATADATGFYNMIFYLDPGNPLGIVSSTVSQEDLAGNTSKVTTSNFSGYTVASGDTLISIAKRFNTTVDALKILNNLTSDVIQPNQILRLPVTASELLNLGYMYFGSSKDYLSSVNQTASSVNTVSPSYFDINPDGTLKLTSSLDPGFVAALHQQGIRIVPFLSNHWNRDIGRALLANKELAAQQIANAIALYNLDGVNIDIENVTEIDRNNYTEFVRLLRQLVPASKEVSVSVAANPNGWTVGWHGSYDYTSLAKYADYLMIMSYDESFPGGDPGPVASMPWVEKSIQYAINQSVPVNKIVMGIAQYGRYWIEGASYGGFGISNWQVEDLISKYGGNVIYDEKSQSAKAVITIKQGDPQTVVGGTTLAPGTYTIWYENEESILQKLSLVSKYNLRGIGNWSIGQEMKDIWSIYATALPAIVPVPVATPTDLTSTAAIPVVPSYTVNYTVVSGDSLSAIAKKYNTTVTAIKDQNHLTTDTIFVGQVLTITTTNVPVSNPVKTYTVVSGDTLSVIAKRYNITVTALKEANNLASDVIYVGQILKIPSS